MFISVGSSSLGYVVPPCIHACVYHPSGNSKTIYDSVVGFYFKSKGQMQSATAALLPFGYFRRVGKAGHSNDETLTLKVREWNSER